MTPNPQRVAMRKQAEMTTEASKALMKWLARKIRGAKHIYVVGGAVRNFKLDAPIKDIDMVVDSLNLGKNAGWVANEIAHKIPAMTRVEGPDNLGVAKVHVTSQWIVDGHDFDGETLDIVDARKEEYATDPATGEYIGHKPTGVVPTTLEDDVTRREFTFNTLMWRLSDLAKGPDQAEIIDLTGCGVKDLEAREMRCPMDADEVFALDPSRIIRIIKFAFKYGFKLPPDVKAAAKRQAKGLKRIPSKAYAAIKDIALESPDYKKALDVMADLGVTDVMAEIMKDDNQFRTSLVRYAEKKGIAYLFDLMDVGIPVGASMDFLTAPQQKRLREITAPMDREEAMAFLNALRNPGKAYRDGRFIPSLAQERGIAKKQMRSFMPEVNEVAREIILKEPTLVDDPNALKGAVRSRVIKASEALPGGKARGKKPSDFDAGELAAGIKVEQEHLVGDGYSKQESDDIAREIAMDHLAEIPDYYTRLDKMESEAGVKHATQRVVLRWLAAR